MRQEPGVAPARGPENDGLRRRAVALGLMLGGAAFLITDAFPGHTAFDDVASPISAALVIAFAMLQLFPRTARAANVGVALLLTAFVAAKTAHILFASPGLPQFSMEAAIFVPWGPVIVTAAWVLFGGSRKLYVFVAGYYAAVLIPGIWLLVSRATLPPAPVLTVGVNLVLASLVVTITLRFMIELETRHAASEAHRQILREMAMVDVVTSLPNRRALEDGLDREIARGARTERPPSILFFDIDGFKVINDREGHDAGDRVLAAIGAVVRQSLRTADMVGRWGGDEFLAILPDAELEQAVGMADRIRRVLAAGMIQAAGMPVTCSFGVTRCGSGEAVAEAVARADRALYAAKAGGKNRTEAVAA